MSHPDRFEALMRDAAEERAREFRGQGDLIDHPRPHVEALQWRAGDNGVVKFIVLTHVDGAKVNRIYIQGEMLGQLKHVIEELERK